MPLENLSGDPQQDYFANGITEALITELGRIRTLRVVSRSSVMAYKGGRKALDQVARELKVDAVVEGAVVREGGRVRVTAQLIRVRPERQVWADRYEREISSILALQADLAHAIAGEVRAKLTQPELAPLQVTREANPEAYEAYLKGRFQFNKATAAGLRSAREAFEDSFRKDRTSRLRTRALPTRTPCPIAPRARRCSRRKRSFRRRRPPRSRRWRLMTRSPRRMHRSPSSRKRTTGTGRARSALTDRRSMLNPSYATGAPRVCALPHHSAALRGSLRAHPAGRGSLVPLSRRVRNGKGWLYLWSGQFEEAIRQAQTMLELEPDFAQRTIF